jgi:hypothetical protein
LSAAALGMANRHNADIDADLGFRSGGAGD